jgi:acetate kinase
MQYTIRGVPPVVDSALRERARAAGKSLNEAAVEALSEGSGMSGLPRKRRDLRDIAGTWKADKAVESALAAQDRVDKALWR